MKALNQRASDPCLDPCGDSACQVQPAEFVRLRYFFGQRLGVVDLADEQAYVVGKQRFHNARLHGCGVLCGLRVDRYVFPQGSTGTDKTTLLRVRRGAALDCCGREIIVGWDSCIDVAAWYAQHPEAKPAKSKDRVVLWVALCYRECPSDPAPAPRDPCGCDADGCEYARVREGFELKLLTEAEIKLLASSLASPPAPKSSATPSSTTPLTSGNESLAGRPNIEGTLARDGVASANAVPSDGAAAASAPASFVPLPEQTRWSNPYGRIGEILAQAMAADCPDPHDSCVILARIEAAVDATTGSVTDLKVDNNTPLRTTLLPTSLLQKGLLLTLEALQQAERETVTGPSLALPSFTPEGQTAGSLIFPVEGSPFLLDPIAAGQLSVKVVSLHADGTSSAAAVPDTAYDGTVTPPAITLKWGAGLAAGTYRVIFIADTTQPPVDIQLRPLTPLSSAQHITLVDDSTATELKLSAAVFA